MAINGDEVWEPLCERNLTAVGKLLLSASYMLRDLLRLP
jgi:hypothetical protein